MDQAGFDALKERFEFLLWNSWGKEISIGMARFCNWIAAQKVIVSMAVSCEQAGESIRSSAQRRPKWRTSQNKGLAKAGPFPLGCCHIP